MTQYVYVFSNPAFPDLLKIGKTVDPNRRLKELSRSSGVPSPFECKGLFEVIDMDKTESALHRALDSDRFNPKREFFEKSYEDIYPILSLLGREETNVITLDIGNEEEIKNVKKKTSRKRFTFSMVEIPVGSTLQFRDGNHECIVKDDCQVEYKGKITYLSPLTKKILNIDRPLRGPDYWKYNGRLIKDLYEDYMKLVA